MITATTGTMLLVMIRVRLISKTGKSFSIRALLDSASEASFVTERVIQQLTVLLHALWRRKAHVIVSDLQGFKIRRSMQAILLRVRSEYSVKSVFANGICFAKLDV